MRVQLRSTILAILLGTHSLTVTPQSIEGVFVYVHASSFGEWSREKETEKETERRERREKERKREILAFVGSQARIHAYGRCARMLGVARPTPRGGESSGAWRFWFCLVPRGALALAAAGLLAGRV